jgi:hypothetical protein
MLARGVHTDRIYAASSSRIMKNIQEGKIRFFFWYFGEYLKNIKIVREFWNFGEYLKIFQKFEENIFEEYEKHKDFWRIWRFLKNMKISDNFFEILENIWRIWRF